MAFAATAEGRLAGSTLTLDRALRNIVKLGIPLADAVRMLTLNPATLLGIEFKKGALRTGADADIVLLNEAFEITRFGRAELPVSRTVTLRPAVGESKVPRKRAMKK